MRAEAAAGDRAVRVEPLGLVVALPYPADVTVVSMFEAETDDGEPAVTVVPYLTDLWCGQRAFAYVRVEAGRITSIENMNTEVAET